MSDEGLEATIEQSDFKAPMAGFGYVALFVLLPINTITDNDSSVATGFPSQGWYILFPRLLSRLIC